MHHLIELAEIVLEMLTLKFKDAKKKSQQMDIKFENTRDFI